MATDNFSKWHRPSSAVRVTAIFSIRVSLAFDIFVFLFCLMRILLKFACHEVTAWYYWRLSFIFDFPRFIIISFLLQSSRNKRHDRFWYFVRSQVFMYLLRNIIHRWSCIFTVIWSIDIIIIIYHELSISIYSNFSSRVCRSMVNVSSDATYKTIKISNLQ